MTGDGCLRQAVSPRRAPGPKGVQDVPGEDMPLLVIARLMDGQVITYYDVSLPPELRRELDGQIRDIRFPVVDRLVDSLHSAEKPVEIGHYKTYVFPAHYAEMADPDVRCLSREDPLVQAFGFGGFTDRVYAIERNGRIASACVSARENDSCGEAWVFTDPAYRHRGLAQKVVGAWAKGLISVDRVPFYSHKIQNDASASLARRLMLQLVFEELVIARLAD